MPEQDNNHKERLIAGEASPTDSSDEAISATLDQIRRERFGLPTPEVVIEGEPLAPVSVSSNVVGVNEETILKGSPANLASLKPHQSAFALAIHNDRQRQRKKAA